MRLALVLAAVALALAAVACGGGSSDQQAVQSDSSTPWGLSVARSSARWAENGDIVANVNVDGGPTRLRFSLWQGDRQVWCCLDLEPETAPEPRLANFATTVALPHDVKATLDRKAAYRLGVEAFRQDAPLATLDADVSGPVPEVDPNW